MKVYYMLFLATLSTNLWSLEQKELIGSWVRTYGVFSPFTASGSTSGGMVPHNEKLEFHPDNIVYISDDKQETASGKSKYVLLKRDQEDFLVLYSPGQDPKDTSIQDKQGFFISLKNSDNKVELNLLTVPDKKKKVKVSISYTRDSSSKSEKNVEFIVPSIKK